MSKMTKRDTQQDINQDQINDIFLETEMDDLKKKEILKNLDEEIKEMRQKYLFSKKKKQENQIEVNDEYSNNQEKLQFNSNEDYEDYERNNDEFYINDDLFQNDFENNQVQEIDYEKYNENNENEEIPRDLDNEISMSMNNQSIRSMKEVDYSQKPRELFKNGTVFLSKPSKDNKIKYKSKQTQEFDLISSQISRVEAEKQYFPKEYSFKNKKNHDFLYDKHDYKPSKRNEELLERLSQPKTSEINKRMKEKEEKDLKKMRKECTFQPEISPYSRNLLNKEEVYERAYGNIDSHNYDYNINSACYNRKTENKTVTISNWQVSDRLYRLSGVMKQRREKMRRENEENQEKAFTFQPKIHENSKILMRKYENQAPIYERYKEVMNERDLYKHNMVINKEKDDLKKNNFFRPKINSKSKEIIERRRKIDISADNIETFHGERRQIDIKSTANANERLYNDGISKLKHRQKQEILNENDKKHITDYSFKPSICSSFLEPDERKGNIKDFLSRQMLYEEIKKEKKQRIASHSIGINRDFIPKINTMSEILMKADVKRQNEKQDDKIERLYRTENERIKSKREALEKFYYSEITFKPKINQISKVVGRDSGIEQLAYKKESEKVRFLKEEQSKTDLNEYSFKPKTNKGKSEYKHVESNYRIDENMYLRIEEEVKAKESKLSEKKKEIEEKENEENQFKPRINQKAPLFELSEPLVLKGFSRHLEQMEKARRMRLEKEERERKVFINGENWSKDNLVTIPKPFNLSYVSIFLYLYVYP